MSITDAFFNLLDSNDTWSNHCMSLVCSKNHTLRKNLLIMYAADMDYVEFF